MIKKVNRVSGNIAHIKEGNLQSAIGLSKTQQQEVDMRPFILRALKFTAHIFPENFILRMKFV